MSAIPILPLARLCLIARQNGYELSTLIERSQLHAQCDARRECYRHLDECGWTATQIGRVFRRDEATVREALGRKTQSRLVREMRRVA